MAVKGKETYRHISSQVRYKVKQESYLVCWFVLVNISVHSLWNETELNRKNKTASDLHSQETQKGHDLMIFQTVFQGNEHFVWRFYLEQRFITSFINEKTLILPSMRSKHGRLSTKSWKDQSIPSFWYSSWNGKEQNIISACTHCGPS